MPARDYLDTEPEPIRGDSALELEGEEPVVSGREHVGGYGGPRGDRAGVLEGSPALISGAVPWAYNLADPWGNQYELNCYDYDRIRTELVEADGIDPVRYWPRDLYDQRRAEG